MAAKILDVDTSVQPFRTIQPPRYTLTDEDTVRVSVGLDLAEVLGGDKFNQRNGLNPVLMLDNGTSDAERGAEVTRVIVANRYVASIASEPVVTVTEVDGAPRYNIATEVLSVFGTTVALEF